MTVETPQEAVEVREVLERGDRVGPTEVLIVTIGAFVHLFLCTIQRNKIFQRGPLRPNKT